MAQMLDYHETLEDGSAEDVVRLKGEISELICSTETAFNKFINSRNAVEAESAVIRLKYLTNLVVAIDLKLEAV
jgi:hypothetical protein